MTDDTQPKAFDRLKVGDTVFIKGPYIHYRFAKLTEVSIVKVEQQHFYVEVDGKTIKLDRDRSSSKTDNYDVWLSQEDYLEFEFRIRLRSAIYKAVAYYRTQSKLDTEKLKTIAQLLDIDIEALQQEAVEVLQKEAEGNG